MSRLRFPVGLALAGLLAAVPAAASAHTELAASDPTDGAVVDDSPSEVVLTFDGEIGEESTFSVTGPTGDEVGVGQLDLDVADRDVLRGDVSVVEVGTYVVAYAVLGLDGHEITGEVTFTYEPKGTVSPNTAIGPAVASPALTVTAGLLLVSVAAVLLGRKAVHR
jgi:copper resistance protein C